MNQLTNDDFIEFMESYKNKVYIDESYKIHKCFDTVTELSRSDTDRADPLVRNSQEMYGLDWIVKSSKLNNKNPPKSTDALFFREDEYGNLCLHIIEFKFLGKKTQSDKINILWSDIRKKLACEKFKKEKEVSDEANDESVDGTMESDVEKSDHNNEIIGVNDEIKVVDEANEESIDGARGSVDESDKSRDDNCDESDECFDEFFVRDFKLIKKDFNDPIAVSLKLKPYEVIFITLPKLYEEYCNENNVIKKDINSYLNKIDKYYWAFLGNFSQSEYNIKSKTDVYDEYSERLEMTIFKKARIKPWQRFNGILNREILGNFYFDNNIGLY